MNPIRNVPSFISQMTFMYQKNGFHLSNSFARKKKESFSEIGNGSQEQNVKSMETGKENEKITINSLATWQCINRWIKRKNTQKKWVQKDSNIHNRKHHNMKVDLVW